MWLCKACLVSLTVLSLVKACCKTVTRSDGSSALDCPRFSAASSSTARQSPIDLPATTLLSLNGDTISTVPLVYNNYDTSITMQFIVSGNTVEAMVDQSGTVPSIVVNGNTYNALQFHLHWSSSDTQGAEHTVVGTTFPLELHIVHIRSDITNTADALAQRDGLAVVGILYTVGDGSSLTTLENAMPTLVQDQTASVDINLSLGSLLPANRVSQWRYEGSLTTPDFAEAVQWQVLRTYQTVSAAQLALFRQIEPTGNFRAVQDLAGRPVACF